MKAKHISDGLIEMFDEIVAYAEKREHWGRIGVPALHELVGDSVAEGSAVVFEGGDSEGRLDLAVALALAHARMQRPVLLISGNVAASSVAERALSSTSSIPLRRLASMMARNDWHTLATASKCLSELPMSFAARGHGKLELEKIVDDWIPSIGNQSSPVVLAVDVSDDVLSILETARFHYFLALIFAPAATSVSKHVSVHATLALRRGQREWEVSTAGTSAASRMLPYDSDTTAFPGITPVLWKRSFDDEDEWQRVAMGRTPSKLGPN